VGGLELDSFRDIAVKTPAKPTIDFSLCPACGRLFSQAQPLGRWLVWCAYGPCKSETGGDGEESKSLDVARERLWERVQGEMA
jgi:hypothetical protein